ncbi:MAG TPA: tetratricopeptide repeat protein [Verrucomicrobiae bacterium]|nr:tetratricopeptide repeat protein [Verrucomicrobiae bacterium]
MGKRSRLKKLSRAHPTGSAASAGSTPAGPFSPLSLSARKRWIFRLLASLLLPSFLLFGVEAILRLTGYGYSTRFFERHAQPGKLTTNPEFAWQFYSRRTATTPTPLLFSKEKAPGARRIFILGESAAAGTPDPAFGFARILEVLLQAQYPSNRFEVLNAAMRGINSHIILPIARECAALSPDLFVVYMGNNETIGLHAPSAEEITFTSHLGLLRLGQQIKGTRLAQWIRTCFPEQPAPTQDMDYFLRQRLAWDDPRRAAVYDNFRANLADMVAVIGQTGVPAVLCSLAVNQRDFPPLASLHRRDLTPAQLADWDNHFRDGTAAEALGQVQKALSHYQNAAQLDDHYAELQYRLARCADVSGDQETARRHFGLARDWDALQFRGDSRLNEIVRTQARGREPQLLFADLEAAFSAASSQTAGVPGAEYFHEHVHFTFAGDYQAALTLLPIVARALALPQSINNPLSRDECARLLAFTPMDDLNVRAAMARQTAKPPFIGQLEHAGRQAELERVVKDRLQRATMADFEQAAGIYRAAMARHPEDWMFHYNYANLLSQFGQANCLLEYGFVVAQLPRQRAFRLAYGNALLKAGRPTEALAQFQAALASDSKFQPALDAMAAARKRMP